MNMVSMRIKCDEFLMSNDKLRSKKLSFDTPTAFKSMGSCEAEQQADLMSPLSFKWLGETRLHLNPTKVEVKQLDED